MSTMEEKKPVDQKLVTELTNSKLFFDISADQIEDMLRGGIGRVSNYEKGDIIVGEGETWNSVDAVLEGIISVKRLFQDGSESQVHVLGKNSIIGMEFMRKPDYGSQFFYIAQTKVRIFSIHQWYFMDYRQLGEKISFQLLKNLISVLSHENIRQHRKLDILSTRDMRGKILVYLNYEQKKHGTQSFEIPYNREKLAAYLCVNRSAMSREISRMEEEGLIRVKGRYFELL